MAERQQVFAGLVSCGPVIDGHAHHIRIDGIDWVDDDHGNTARFQQRLRLSGQTAHLLHNHTLGISIDDAAETVFRGIAMVGLGDRDGEARLLRPV